MEISSSALRSLLEQNTWRAIKDYGRHTKEKDVLNDVSASFVDRLARDAVTAKADLRTMLRRSPAWNEDLQAVIINGTRTHNPDSELAFGLATQLFGDWLDKANSHDYALLRKCLFLATKTRLSSEEREEFIGLIGTFAPNAYKPNRKKSRVIKALCDALGITDESKGSRFQRLYAKPADEINSHKIDFKLFLSINPAHFITMSNPKYDERGDTLTGCHSFNRTEYEYNNGCSGYARDGVTMIAFTVDNPDDAELLNNRKTTRQLFMYKPNNGVLLQSRMYDTRGGINGAHECSAVYRDLVQREISYCEDAVNLWKTIKYHHHSCERNMRVEAGCGFGGYADWEYGDYDPRISIREDHRDNFEKLVIGTYGLCISCGDEISSGLYCDDCKEEDNAPVCDACGCRCDEDELTSAYDQSGEDIWVCRDCLEAHYIRCRICGSWHHKSNIIYTNDGYVCQGCLENYYVECHDCEEFCHIDDAYATEDGYVCDGCYNENDYVTCEDCGIALHDCDAYTVKNNDDENRTVCPSCSRNYNPSRDAEEE